jgi:hypothetical protein
MDFAMHEFGAAFRVEQSRTPGDQDHGQGS